MKRCPQCKKEFNDGTMFCPYCGIQLEASKPIVVPTTDNLLANWAGTILAILGILIMLGASRVLVGFAICGLGAVSGIKSFNSINKAISCIVGVIGAFLIFVYFSEVL